MKPIDILYNQLYIYILIIRITYNNLYEIVNKHLYLHVYIQCVRTYLCMYVFMYICMYIYGWYRYVHMKRVGFLS